MRSKIREGSDEYTASSNARFIMLFRFVFYRIQGMLFVFLAKMRLRLPSCSGATRTPLRMGRPVGLFCTDQAGLVSSAPPHSRKGSSSYIIEPLPLLLARYVAKRHRIRLPHPVSPTALGMLRGRKKNPPGGGTLSDIPEFPIFSRLVCEILHR